MGGGGWRDEKQAEERKSEGRKHSNDPVGCLLDSTVCPELH